MEKYDRLACPLCFKPILGTHAVFFSAGTKLVVHLDCNNRHRKVVGRSEEQETGHYARYGSMS